MENDRLSEFWHTTWSAWRSGIVSPITAQKAAGGYDDFVKTCGCVKDQTILAFFTAHPPLPGEFYISFAGVAKQQPWMVLTSQRLWMYDKQKGNCSEFNLADVAQFEATTGWRCRHCTIRFKDNTERTYQGMKVTIAVPVIAQAIERCSSPDGSTISSPATQTQFQDNQPRKTSTDDRERSKPQIYIMIGLVIGASIPAVIGAKNLIVPCAGLGWLLGYIVYLLTRFGRTDST